jgi:hypothetical protein
MNKFLFCFIGAVFLAGGAQGQQCKDTARYLVPDFYKPVPERSRDTTFKFECYNRHDSIINNVDDFERVFFYSVFKNYIDSTHTYKDARGAKQFLPVSKIVRRYDKVGKATWMCISYPANKISELKEDKMNIVRTDTLPTITGIAIYQYYKTTSPDK